MEPIRLVLRIPEHARHFLAPCCRSFAERVPGGSALRITITPAGKVLAGYLEALNSGNKDKLEAFVKAHRPDRPDALDRMLDLRWHTGGFDLYSVESAQALNIQAVPRLG